MGAADGETAIRVSATLACQARKCTCYRVSAAVHPTPPRHQRPAFSTLTIYWCSKEFFQ